MILIFGILATQMMAHAKENGGGGFDPPGEPCPPMTQSVPFCFTNKAGAPNCAKEVCISFTPKPFKATQLQNCFYDPLDFCITLQPGENGCINIPVPGLPITEWYELNISIRSISSGATPVFAVEPLFLNAEGSGNLGQEIRETGGCAPGHYTFLELINAGVNAYDFFIWNDYILGGG